MSKLVRRNEYRYIIQLFIEFENLTPSASFNKTKDYFFAHSLFYYFVQSFLYYSYIYISFYLFKIILKEYMNTSFSIFVVLYRLATQLGTKAYIFGQEFKIFQIKNQQENWMTYEPQTGLNQYSEFCTFIIETGLSFFLSFIIYLFIVHLKFEICIPS